MEAGGYTVIHNGIDLERYRREEVGARPSPLPAGRRILGTVGSLTREKGTQDLLAAAAALRADGFPDLTVCVVGDEPLRGALEARALSEGVLFTGVVEDVRPWIAAFDVLAMPSRSEGMPLTLVEAMALGCPIVATEAGGVREAVGEVGVLVPRGDPTRLAAALRGVLDDEPARCRLRRDGMARAVGFALADMGRKTAEVYERWLIRSLHRRQWTATADSIPAKIR